MDSAQYHHLILQNLLRCYLTDLFKTRQFPAVAFIWTLPTHIT